MGRVTSEGEVVGKGQSSLNFDQPLPLTIVGP